MVFNSSTSGFHPDSPGATPGPRSISKTWADGLVTCRVSKTPRLGAIPGAHAITANPSRIGSSPAKLILAYKRLVETQEDSVQLRGPGPFLVATAGTDSPRLVSYAGLSPCNSESCIQRSVA